MKIVATSMLAAVIVGGASWLVPAAAHAESLEPCGNISLEASAECELVTGGGCEAMCEPVAVEAACAADLAVRCGGECDAEASVACTADCLVDCQGRCEIDPPEFDCRGACVSDCEGACSGRCASEDGECLASCRGTCGVACDGQCEATPGSADCRGKCEASCEGSCEARANLDCQIDCQSDGFVDCEAELSGGCEVECREPEGALFCDGQYVDRGNNLEECLDALRAVLDIEVEGNASGGCVNGRCEGEAEGSLSCAIGRDTRSSAWAFGWFGAVFTSLLVLARRRRRAR